MCGVPITFASALCVIVRTGSIQILPKVSHFFVMVFSALVGRRWREPPPTGECYRAEAIDTTSTVDWSRNPGSFHCSMIQILPCLISLAVVTARNGSGLTTS